MKNRLVTVVLAGLSVGALANATVTYTWSFGSPGASENVAQGTPFAGVANPSGPNGPNIYVYAEQVNNKGVIQSTPAKENGTSTLGSGADALFNVNGTIPGYSNYQHGTGIAPYDPAEGAFDNQLGINDNVPENSNTHYTYSNILELNLSNVSNGTVLSFLLQGPSGDSVSVYTANASTPQNLGSMTVYDNSVASPLGNGVINWTGTGTTFSLTKTTNNEFVAIQADCHYLVLDSIFDSPGTVPEPRFYGFFAVAMVGLVIGARKLKLRVRAAQQA